MTDEEIKQSFARNLARYMEAKGVNRYQICDALNIKYSTLSEWLQGNKYPRMDKVEMLASYFHIKKSQLIDSTSDSNIDLNDQLPVYRIPVFESISAGLGCYADSKPVSYEYINVESPCEARETMCIKVVGDSMYPKIENGDLVQIRKQTSVDSGSIAAVLIDGDEGVVKRVVYGSDWIELHSLNPLYPPRIFKGADVQRVQVVGLVKRVIRTL